MKSILVILAALVPLSLASCSAKNCDTTTVTAVTNCGAEGQMLSCRLATADGGTRTHQSHVPLGGEFPGVGDTVCK